MKLVRPHIPLSVRLQVIARQLQEQGRLYDVLAAEASPVNGSARLAFMLARMFGDEKVALDHHPALCLREIIDAERGLYRPDANDPDHLVYRTAEDHRVKTFLRGDGAQRSDAAMRRRKLKQERPKRPSRWPPRGARKLQWWNP